MIIILLLKTSLTTLSSATQGEVGEWTEGKEMGESNAILMLDPRVWPQEVGAHKRLLGGACADAQAYVLYVCEVDNRACDSVTTRDGSWVAA